MCRVGLNNNVDFHLKLRKAPWGVQLICNINVNHRAKLVLWINPLSIPMDAQPSCRELTSDRNKEYSTMGSPCKMVTIKTCLEWSVMRSPPALDVYLLPDFKLQPLLALISYLHCSLGNLAVLFGFIRTLEPCQTSLSGSYTILALTTRETEVPHSLPD